MEPFRIEGLEVNQIGPFEHLKLDFPKKQDPEKAEIHIFTGENGTGKTTLLESLINCLPHQNQNSYARRSWTQGEESSYLITLPDNELFFTFQNSEIVFKNGHSTLLQNYQDKLHRQFFSTFDFALFAYAGYRRVNELDLVQSKKSLLIP